MDPQKHIPIKQAISIARIISKQYNIKSYKDWKRFIKEGSEKDFFTVIPPVPSGKTFLLKNFLPFEEAREFVKKLNLKSYKEWKVYCDENHIIDIPSNPEKHYKREWLSVGDFLGIGHKVPSKFRSFNEAVVYVRNLCIENCKEWQEFCDSGDRPKDIPHSPQKIYKNNWQGWNYFLGVGLYRQEFYIEIPHNEIIEEIENDIMWDLQNIGAMIEIFREETDIDEEILEKYKEEPKLFLDGLKKYLKKYPREEEEE